jgi:predicted metal-dependent peptidase
MSGFSYKGVNLKALLASYVPPFAKKFQGKWIQVDGMRVIPHELSDMSKGEIKSLVLGGGGGASFAEAIEYVKNDILENNITNPIVVMASDAHEDFTFELLPNTIFLTTDEGWRYSLRGGNGLIEQGFPNALKGQKVIIVNID